jgi:hypothetical protein
MIAKVFKGGRTSGGARSAAKYLLDEKQHGEKIRVLHGDPKLTISIIDQLDFKWKFTSGVLSFEEQNIPEAHKHEIIKEFEKTMCPGLNINSLWVEHRDKNRLELHYMIPRVDLDTGKSIAVYTHLKDFNKKDLFQEYINTKYNLSSPHDLEKKETLQQRKTRWNDKRQDIAQELDQEISKGVANGTIQNRDDVLDLFKELQIPVNRVTKNGITIQWENKPIRLKGLYYGKDFTSASNAIEQARAGAETVRIRSKKEPRRELTTIRSALERIVQRDLETNRKNYDPTKQRDSRKARAEARLVELGKVDVRDRSVPDRRTIEPSVHVLQKGRDNQLQRREQEKSNSHQAPAPSTNTIKGVENDSTRSAIARYARAREKRAGGRKERINELSRSTLLVSRAHSYAKQRDSNALKGVDRSFWRRARERAKALFTRRISSIARNVIIQISNRLSRVLEAGAKTLTSAYQQQERKEFMLEYLGAKEHIEGIEKYTQMHGKFEHIKLELEQCKTSREIKALQVEKKVEQVAETWDKLEAMQQRVQSRGRGLSR